MYAGGVAPELLLYGKKTPKDTWVITIDDLKGCSGELTLTFYSNNTSFNLTANDESITYTSESNLRTAKINVTGASLVLKFAATANTRLDNLKLTGTVLAEGYVATPAITGETPFKGSTEVTITGAEGSTIYYTTDGNDPTTTTLNNGVSPLTFTLDKTATVKAIAVKDDKTSGVASKEFEKMVVYEGLSGLVTQLREDGNTSSATAGEYLVKLRDAVVTGVDGSNAYLEEKGTGLLLYKRDHGLNVGDVLSGEEVTVTGYMYNGIPEITSFTGETKSTGGTLPLTEVTLAELVANPETYMSRRVKVADATVEEATAENITIIKQGEQSLTVYDKISDEFSLAQNAKVTLTGYVTLKSENVQIYVLNATDVTSEGGLTEPNVYFSSTEVSVNLGETETFIVPTLNKDSDGAVTYTSSNTEVATVNAETGVVTFNNVAGTTTITATVAETATYAAAEASYTLTVVDPNAPVYVLVTSASQLVPGDSYLIASKDNNRVMGWQKNTSSRAAASATFTENNVLATIATAKNNETDAFEFTLGGKNGEWTLYDPLTQGFLTSNGSNNGIKTNDAVGTYSYMDIVFADANGNLNINFTKGSNNSLRCNLDSEIFRCYATSSGLSTNIQLYHKVIGGKENRAIDVTLKAEDKETETFYATYYSEEALRLPEGLEAGIITNAAENGTLTVDYRYTDGATIPAKTAVILRSTTTEHTLAATTSTETAPEGNLLHGADAVDAAGFTYVEGTNVKYYILTSSATKKLGFYWAAPNGAAVTYQAPYAFLAIDGASAVNGLFFGGETTGIEGVEAENDTQAIFDLSGRRVQNAQKGIYIVNGKKVLVK